jgi:hypothetical protein
MKKFFQVVIATVLLLGCRDEEPAGIGPVLPQAGILRAVQTIASSWNDRQEYTYHPDGRISKIQWERNTPFTTQGIETFMYDNYQRLTHLIREQTGLADEEIRYTYEGNKISEAASYYQNEKYSFSRHTYNSAGQLVMSRFYTRVFPGHEFILDTEVQYSYHSHQNLREVNVFTVDQTTQEKRLHTTRVYPDYLLDRAAVMDTEHSLPGVRLQKHLPTGYQLKTPTSQMNVSFTYRWLPNGKLLDRVSTFSNGGSEQTVYTIE